jgi:hypothetical protein
MVELWKKDKLRHDCSEVLCGEMYRRVRAMYFMAERGGRRRDVLMDESDGAERLHQEG